MPTTTKRRVKKSRKPKPKQLLVRTSERSSFNTCLHQWQWAWIENRRPIFAGPALRFGDLIHRALEKRYPPGIKRGPHPAKTFEKLYEETTAEAYSFGFRDEDGEWMEAGELGVDMLERYVDHYGTDEEWEVIASEQTFRQEVKDPATGLYLFTYVGTLDGVWRNRFDSGVRINDYKTTSHDPLQEVRNPGYTGILSLQAGAYWTWGVDWLIDTGILTPELHADLDGMVFTYLRKAKADTRPQNEKGQYLNKNGSVSKVQPAPFFHREVIYRSQSDRDRQRARAIEQVKRMIELRKAPSSARTKKPHWLNCRMCAFKDACELHESGDENWQEFLEGTTEVWDPYDTHEIEHEGKG